jgi:hypothetical protein
MRFVGSLPARASKWFIVINSKSWGRGAEYIWYFTTLTIKSYNCNKMHALNFTIKSLKNKAYYFIHAGSVEPHYRHVRQIIKKSPQCVSV